MRWSVQSIVVLAVAFVVGGYVVRSSIRSYADEKAKRRAEEAKAQRIEEDTRAAVSKMVTLTSAVVNWEAELSKGEKFRYGPILTIELERLWLQPRPILFVGSIKDVVTHDQSQYVVLVERSPYGNTKHYFGTELHLSIVASKDRVDSFLEEHPGLVGDYRLESGVAVVARIMSIKKASVPDSDGDLLDIRIGEGELLDMVYTGKVEF